MAEQTLTVALMQMACSADRDSNARHITDQLRAASAQGVQLVLLQELLNQLSAGNIDPDFLLKQRSANPIESACEIRLFLQRRRQGQFDATFDDGAVFGSTSAEVTVQYMAPVTAN